MFSFNSPNTSQQFHTGILVNQHITVHAAAEVTDYNIQYLRRILRSGALKGYKIDQMWLIDMDAGNSIINAKMASTINIPFLVRLFLTRCKAISCFPKGAALPRAAIIVLGVSWNGSCFGVFGC